MNKKIWKKIGSIIAFIALMVLFTYILAIGAPERVGGNTTWQRMGNAFSAPGAFAGVLLIALYPLVIRLNRAVAPVTIKNQVEALMDLAKDPNWDASDMGQRLSNLASLNQANGECLTKGVLLAGFPSRVLEEYANKNDDDLLKKWIDEYRQEDVKQFFFILMLLPWIALMAFLGLPLFVASFRIWSPEIKIAFVGLVLAVYGAISLKTAIGLLKK